MIKPGYILVFVVALLVSLDIYLIPQSLKIETKEPLPVGGTLTEDKCRSSVRIAHGQGSNANDLFIFSKEVPGGIASNESDDRLFRSFIENHPGIWGMEAPPSADELVLDHTEELASSVGYKMHKLRYHQSYCGHPILDHEITATFWNGQLTSITGILVGNETLDGLDPRPLLSPEEASEIATKALADYGSNGLISAKVHVLGIDIDRKSLAYDVHASADKDYLVPGKEDIEPYLFRVDAKSGEIFWTEPLVES